MSLDDFDRGAADPVGAESRRLAYMLDGAGDPHLAAAELSQDISGLNTPFALSLIRTIQGYEDPSASIQLTVQPVVSRNLYGFVTDTGTRNVRVVGRDADGQPVNDLVATLLSVPTPPFDTTVDETTIDPFASVQGLAPSPLFVGKEAEYWRDSCARDRNYWSNRSEWTTYDGRHNGWHPNQIQSQEYGFHKAGSLEHSRDVVKNYYDGHQTRPGNQNPQPGVPNAAAAPFERQPLVPLEHPYPHLFIPREPFAQEPFRFRPVPDRLRPVPDRDDQAPQDTKRFRQAPDRHEQATEPLRDRGQHQQEELYQHQQDEQRQHQLDQEQELQQQKRQQEQQRQQERQRERDQHQAEQERQQRERDQREQERQQRQREQDQRERERQEQERRDQERRDQERRDQERRDEERRQQEQHH